MQAMELQAALVDPMVRAQLAAPRAAVRQAALESLSELDLSLGSSTASVLNNRTKRSIVDNATSGRASTPRACSL